MTFEEILKIEPRLKPIIIEAEKMKHHKWHIKSMYWHRNLKPQMTKLVGMMSKNEKLSSCDTYDTVYRYFIDLMKI
uniref:Uncharacterized protein n=1 Tax=viral metagenome TaxID=1070528 RepID=A0A6M3JLQ0_9ZZZZ